jgi:hypothetical protein
VDGLIAAGGSSAAEARQLLTAREGLQSAERASEAIGRLSSVPVEVQRFEIGEVAFVAVPGEIFSEAQRTLDAALPGRRARIVGPANGYMGYFPSAEAYDVGGYEVGASLVERGAAEEIVDAAISLFVSAASSQQASLR